MIESSLFCPSTDDLDVVEAEFRGFVVEPVNPPFHWLNEYELHVGTGNSKDQTRKTGAAADVSRCSRTKKWGDDAAIQNVSRPEARKFEGADEAEFFTATREVCGVLASERDAVTENGDRSRGLKFYCFVSQCFT